MFVFIVDSEQLINSRQICGYFRTSFLTPEFLVGVCGSMQLTEKIHDGSEAFSYWSQLVILDFGSGLLSKE
jgi:hypothetical protein